MLPLAEAVSLSSAYVPGGCDWKDLTRPLEGEVRAWADTSIVPDMLSLPGQPELRERMPGQVLRDKL
jgi:hypothetical protein